MRKLSDEHKEKLRPHHGKGFQKGEKVSISEHTKIHWNQGDIRGENHYSPELHTYWK